MDLLMLPKDRVGAVVEALLATRRVIAPVRREGTLRWQALDAADQAVLDYRNTPASPKAVFFPQVERMLRFQRTLDRHNEVSGLALDETPTVLLGVRPCDARGFLLLDRVFLQEHPAPGGLYTDPYYAARRRNTVVVAVGCERPRSTCFCHAFASGPYDRAGSDVFLRDAGDAYLVEAVTERGAALLEGLGLPAADAAHGDRAGEIEAQAQTRLELVEPVAGVTEMLDGLWASDVWAEVSAKCLACGTCTYTCPECHCFNIEDRALADGGERVRAWDGCMYPTFTLHASGHNPRPDQASRWRQRVMHKFSYLPRNVDLYGCVGCGRCVVSCPVRLDIRQVLAAVRGAATRVAAETTSGAEGAR